MKMIIGYIFAFYATKSRDSLETMVDPHWVQDQPWSFNGPWHGPTIHPTWPFINWLYFPILCNKHEIKGLWGHKGQPSFGLGPTLVLQWTLPWPYNTSNMAFFILAIFLYTMQQKWDQGTRGTKRSTLIGCGTCLGSSMDPTMALQYTKHGPLYIGYIFAFYATKIRFKGLWGHKGPPLSGLGPFLVLQWTLP